MDIDVLQYINAERKTDSTSNQNFFVGIKTIKYRQYKAKECFATDNAQYLCWWSMQSNKSITTLTLLIMVDNLAFCLSNILLGAKHGLPLTFSTANL